MTVLEVFEQASSMGSVFEPDPKWQEGKPVALIYASCHGRTLRGYLEDRADFKERFNLLRLETGPMTLLIQDGHDIFGAESIRRIFGMADVILTYNMGARMGPHALDRVGRLFKAGNRVITFVAPNFSAFCPFAFDGYGSHIGLHALFDSGIDLEDAWQKIIHYDFDPLFAIRWRLEIGRYQDKERYHEIGLSDFIIRAHKKVKLWMGASHPSYIPMAYVGSEICGRLGLPRHNEEDILRMDYLKDAVGGQPETDYEFRFYRFDYPKRHENDAGGWDYYRKIFDCVYAQWKAEGAYIRPQVD